MVACRGQPLSSANIIIRFSIRLQPSDVECKTAFSLPLSLPDPAAAPGARCFFFVFLIFIIFFIFFCNSIWLQGREEASLYWLDPKTNHAALANARLQGRWLGWGRGGVPEEQLSLSGGGAELGDAGALERLRSD